MAFKVLVIDQFPCICGCGTVLNHYKKMSAISGMSPEVCCVADCENTDIEGVQVKDNSRDPNNIIVLPLCKQHSVPRSILSIKSNTLGIYLDKNRTCEANSHPGVGVHIGMMF